MISSQDQRSKPFEESLHNTCQAVTPSPNIPLPSTHVTRTQSEVQLTFDEAIAEQRDAHMFHRLVNGIRQRQTIAHPTHGGHTVQARQIPACRTDERLQSNKVASPQLYDLDSNAMPREKTDFSDSWSITGFENVPSAEIPLHYAPSIENDETSQEEFIFTLDDV